MESLKEYVEDLKKRKYHLSLYSNDSNAVTKNINFTKQQFLIFLAIVAAGLAFFVAFVVSTVSMSQQLLRSPDVAKLRELENKVRNLTTEIMVVQEYSNQIKYVLGDTSTIQNINSFRFDSLLKSLSDEEIKAYANKSLDENELSMPLATPVSSLLITQEFDDDDNHFGVDFAGNEGDPIYAAADGIVMLSNYTTDYGNTIIVIHSNRFITKYMHNLANLKTVGNYVYRGEVIAMLGNTGRLSSNPHLHFEIWKNGIAKDPLKYLLN
jgi:murein DD-endopeptidase MepM/ murein hydrolase activator NlpD